jgi:hypothetical protein
MTVSELSTKSPIRKTNVLILGQWRNPDNYINGETFHELQLH